MSSSGTQTTASSLALIPGRWVIDPNHSAITFSTRFLGLSKVRGRFRVFNASLDVGPSGTEFEVEASIELASIDTSIPRRDEHLRTADYFHVDQHPTMTFRSTRIEPVGASYTMSGDLTLKGLTRAVTVEVEPNGLLASADGRTRFGLRATGALRRSDLEFGLQPLGLDRLVLGDKIEFVLDMQFVWGAGS
jgi:polyisoprenoid-binding protein YceI